MDIDRFNMPCVKVEELIATPELLQRTQRESNFCEENRGFRQLAETFSSKPEVFQETLVNVALQLCHADTVGMSVEETTDEGNKVFRWAAMAGSLRHMAGRTTPRNFSPCGICLDKNQPLLMKDLSRAYPYLENAALPFVETLIFPWGVNSGEPVGTLWVVAHSDRRKFDLQDVRIMSGLASFAFGSINLHQKLRSAERRAAALNMTAAMAHHINNPLQGAMFALFRLRSEGNLDETSLELLDIAETELARVAALSSDLLRGDEIKPAYVKGVPNSSQLNLELLR